MYACMQTVIQVCRFYRHIFTMAASVPVHTL
nr:MAG TPA: hypothetical protein [Caudoviricetes sp.]